MLVHRRFGPAPMSGHRFRRPLGPPRPRQTSCGREGALSPRAVAPLSLRGTSVTGPPGIYHGCVLRGQGGRASLRIAARTGRTVATVSVCGACRMRLSPLRCSTIAPRRSLVACDGPPATPPRDRTRWQIEREQASRRHGGTGAAWEERRRFQYVAAEYSDQCGLTVGRHQQHSEPVNGRRARSRLTNPSPLSSGIRK